MGDLRRWNQTIGKMANAFELLGLDYNPSNEDEPAIAEGLELFYKYFRKLWDWPRSGDSAHRFAFRGMMEWDQIVNDIERIIIPNEKIKKKKWKR